MKVNRNYRFVLTVTDADSELAQECRTGEFMFQSECHYYAEKNIIEAIKAAEKIGPNELAKYYGHKYGIYKETKPQTVTETRPGDNPGETITVTREIPGKAMLVEIITVDENEINIR